MISTQTEIAALVLTVAVHIVGATALIWGMIDHDDPDRGSWRDWWPKDDRGDDGPPPAPEPTPSGDSVVPVLPSSAPAPVRIGNRSHPPRIGDLTPKRERRPAHPAHPVPERVPERVAD